MNWNFLIGPIVGGVIGYITNGIAIKMLFRPLRPIYIGGKALPFTPGLIPKEKKRIANSIGEVVGKELLTDTDLMDKLLSQEVEESIKKHIRECLKNAKDNDTTIETYIGQWLEKEEKENIETIAKTKLSEWAYHKLQSINVGKIIAQGMVEQVKGSNILGPLAFFVNDSLIENLAGKLEEMINEKIEEEGYEKIQSFVENETATLQTATVGALAASMQPYNDQIEKIGVDVYRNLIKLHLPNILQVINIKEMISNRVDAFEPLELEKLILQVMDKELKAIIWLGALLGLIMGCIMNFF